MKQKYRLVIPISLIPLFSVSLMSLRSLYFIIPLKRSSTSRNVSGEVTERISVLSSIFQSVPLGNFLRETRPWAVFNASSCFAGIVNRKLIEPVTFTCFKLILYFLPNVLFHLLFFFLFYFKVPKKRGRDYCG